jgi:hypothetical protein
MAMQLAVDGTAIVRMGGRLSHAMHWSRIHSQRPKRLSWASTTRTRVLRGEVVISLVATPIEVTNDSVLETSVRSSWHSNNPSPSPKSATRPSHFSCRRLHQPSGSDTAKLPRRSPRRSLRRAPREAGEASMPYSTRPDSRRELVMPARGVIVIGGNERRSHKLRRTSQKNAESSAFPAFLVQRNHRRDRSR